MVKIHLNTFIAVFQENNNDNCKFEENKQVDDTQLYNAGIMSLWPMKPDSKPTREWQFFYGKKCSHQGEVN